MRATNAPNLPIEDGLKEPLLCGDCEERFCDWETVFSNELYYPLHSSKRVRFSYDPELEEFAVSMTWRVLLFHKLHNGLAHVPNHLMSAVHVALKDWKDYLLGITKNVGQFEQHLLVFAPVASTDMLALSPYLNRYLLRTLDMEWVAGFIWNEWTASPESAPR